MDYLGDIAVIQQELAGSHDMTARRVRVLEALAAAPGERILEVGCGAGRYLREIGVAVGQSGSAVGIDLSEDQIRVAKEHCAGLIQVKVRRGDVLNLHPVDEVFDASLSVQVLEYVAPVEEAVTEIGRVTRPGGRFVNVATNWGALFWSGGDASLTAQVLSIWERHAPHTNLPIVLPALLRSAGFGGVHQGALTVVNRHFHPGTFSYGIARLMAAFAMANEELSQHDVEMWLDSLKRAESNDRFFLSSVPVLTTATRIARN